MRRSQRGFLYLTTGANGAGKTLFTLKHVKDMADKEARPVCYNGRFDLDPSGPLANWKKIDIKDWQAEPDGTIFVVDECHNDFPVRGNSTPVPEYVRMLAEHRKRGFDFFLITQHPMNIDAFVRRLIGDPGWHRHLKRTFGGDMVSRLQWAAVNPQCEKAGSGDSGEVKVVPFPKEVYSWYKSAMIHTGKRSIPRAVYVVAACVLLVPALGYFGFKTFFNAQTDRQAKIQSMGGTPTAVVSAGQGYRAPGAPASDKPVMTAAEYVQARTPRIPGFQHTASAYDSITQPKEAPYPAACITGVRPGTKVDVCHCYTTQGTKLQTPEDVCRQIAANGFFVEWHQERRAERVQPLARVEPAAQSSVPPVFAAAPMPVAAPSQAAASGPASFNAVSPRVPAPAKPDAGVKARS